MCILLTVCQSKAYVFMFTLLTAGSRLEEITQNRGLLYDESAVNACVSLFRKKGFRWD